MENSTTQGTTQQSNVFTDDYSAIPSTMKSPIGGGNIFQPEGVLLYTYMISGILGIIGNGLVTVVIVKFTKVYKHLTNLFIVHQSVIDFLASLTLLLLTGTQKQYHIYGVGAEVLCRVWLSMYILWSLFTTSTYNLCVMSLEKYFSIVHPILHKKAFDLKFAVAGMVLAWVVGLLTNSYNLPTSGLHGDICFRLAFWPSTFTQRATGVVNCIIKFFLPLLIMLYTYGRILHVIHQKVAPHPETGQQSGNQYLAARRNTVKMLVLVCACFILCWSWNQFFFLALNLGASLQLGGAFYQFSVVAVFFNSCINPFIYIFKYREFQRGLRKMLTRCAPAVAGGESETQSTAPYSINNNRSDAP